MPVHQRRADAIGLVAEGALNGGIGAGNRADRFQVVVHVHAGDLMEVRADAACGEDAGAAPERSIEHGPRVSAETCRRLACDAGRVVMTHDRSGGVLDVGRKTRTVPPAIRRALRHRDEGCRFPGCTNRICDAHHVVHWADGGENQADQYDLGVPKASPPLARGGLPGGDRPGRRGALLGSRGSRDPAGPASARHPL
jgi:hypothetical protein